MSGPGKTTVTINCMIVSGFPGIGKTSTYLEMKKSFIGARCADMDVRDYGTTNGIDVADPAAYAAKVVELSKENAAIFVTMDAAVRQKLREANLFYIVVAPEFPPEFATHMPSYRPDPLARAMYMKRFTDNLGYNSLAATTLDGKGYTDAISDIFNDPMPHIVTPILTKDILGNIWNQIDAMSRQHMSPGELQKMAGGQKGMKMPEMPGAPNKVPGLIL